MSIMIENQSYRMIDSTTICGVEYGLYENDKYGDMDVGIVLNLNTYDVVGYTYDTLIDFLNDYLY